MGGPGTLGCYTTSQRKSQLPALQVMYFLEGGLLMVGNLLKTDSWVGDKKHVNVECTTRICTFCIIRATDASIKANEDAMRGTLLNSRRLSAVSMLSMSSPPEYAWRDKQLTLLSSDSALTLGSVVQLWPQPIPDNETARLQVARHSTICSTEIDPTMNLLVNIVARTLECPAAFIGIMDESLLWIKASVGLDDRLTHMPRDGSICAHTLSQDATMIVNDTSVDKHFHAGDHVVGSSSMCYYAGTPIRVRGHCIGVVCALDVEPHSKTTDAMKSTLEAVANIVSEVLEQRLDRSQPPEDLSMKKEVGTGSDLSCYLQRRSNRTTVDLHASLHGLNLLPASLGMPSSGESSDRNQLNSSHTPYLLLEYADKITEALDYFHYLQSGDWVERNTDAMPPSIETIRTYESSIQESSTISTQEVLAQQQQEMASVIDHHGTQLERLSTALERVESLLVDKTLKISSKGSTPFPMYICTEKRSYEGVELRFGIKSFVRFLKQLEKEQEGEDGGETQSLEMLLATYPDYGQATEALLDSGRIAVPALEDEEIEPLSIRAVHEQLMAIAKDEGAGGVARKQLLALRLLQKCRYPEERMFIVRMLAHQSLRIGMGEKSILAALASASFPSFDSRVGENDGVAGSDSLVQEKDWIESVTLAYAQHPNYHTLAELLHADQQEENIAEKIRLLQNQARPITGVPVLTMSAYPVTSVAAVLDRVSKAKSRTATCEYKNLCGNGEHCYTIYSMKNPDTLNLSSTLTSN
ncbi:hypothetical protein BBJ29_004384 [Phytophthora kernoviae]|uniref:GAF domain-containing protein n=1 Tax=Phytophthora kernoviae TaxID=325452 RepID=A0A3R7GJH6_9STRA|nr:hypothetical protein BBJ29_004384 [Phytophthora kernoviae]